LQRLVKQTNQELGSVWSQHPIIRWLLPNALPKPREELISAVQSAAPRILIKHGLVCSRSAALLDASGLICAQPREVQVSRVKAEEVAAGWVCERPGAIACVLLAGCVSQGCRFIAIVCLCLAIVFKVLHWLDAHRRVANAAIALLNNHNLVAWTRTSVPPAALGAVIEIDESDLASIEPLILDWVFTWARNGAWGWMPMLLRRGGSVLRWLVGSFVSKSEMQVPLVLHFQIPGKTLEIPAQPEPLGLVLPTVDIIVVLEADLSGRGAFLSRAKVVILDMDICNLLSHLRSPILKWDLRQVLLSLSDFPQPVYINFDWDMTWAGCDRGTVKVSDLSLKIPLSA